MRKFGILAAAAAAILAFVSCAEKDGRPSSEADPTVGKTVYLHATTKPLTKAVLTDDYDNSGSFLGSWEVGDVISISYGYDADAEDFIFMQATWSSANGVNAFVGDGLTAQDTLFAFFPEGTGVYYFGSDRVQNGNEFNSDYDIMYSKAFSISEDDTDVTVHMNRITAIQYFHLVADDTAPWANKHVVSATITGGEEDSLGADIYGIDLIYDGMYEDADDTWEAPEGDGGIGGDDVPEGEGGIGGDDGDDGDDEEWEEGLEAGIFLEGLTNTLTITFEEGTAPLAKDAHLWFSILPFGVEYLTIRVELEDGYVWEATNHFTGDGYYYTEGGLAYAKVKPTYVQEEVE